MNDIQLNARQEGMVRVSKFKNDIYKLELTHIKDGLTRHEFRLALVDLLQRDMYQTYNPKRRK